MKILGICGSIRQNSSNWSLLKAVQNYYKDYHKDYQWESIDLARLPYFDPDLQYSEQTPAVVKKLRSVAGSCDLIVISTPEYAHGVPGILKNGLEWIFSEETQKKPVALIVGSAQGEWARDQLLEILKTMDFLITPEHCLLVKGARTKIKSDGTFTDIKTQELFEKFCESLRGL